VVNSAVKGDKVVARHVHIRLVRSFHVFLGFD
jgi:hypothetical protein